MHKPPHINVDAFPLVDSHFSGVGHSLLGIVTGFDELAGQGKLTYSLIAPKNLVHRLNEYSFSNYKKIVGSPIRNRVILSIMKFHIPIPCDLVLGRGFYYFPSFLAWPMWFSKSTVVIHDLTYLDVPDCVDKGNREFLSRVVPFSLKNTRNVMTVSNFSKQRIIAHYRLNPKDIYVAYNAVDRRHWYRRSTAEIRRAKLKYDIYDENYILSVGNIEPRKNYVRLIEAYTQLPKNITDKYPLVIIGAGGWNNEEILQKMQEAKEEGFKIINPKQFVKDEDMPAIYSGAKFFIFPPIYEGFGMSPVEAYACFTPVIASNSTAVPEATGTACLFIDPLKTTEIRDGMEEMFGILETDPNHFKAAMQEHLKTSSWRKSAQITAAAVTGYPLKYFEDEKK